MRWLDGCLRRLEVAGNLLVIFKPILLPSSLSQVVVGFRLRANGGGVQMAVTPARHCIANVVVPPLKAEDGSQN